jgi:hypothetical protein
MYDIKNSIQATILHVISQILVIPGFKIIETSGEEVE